MIKRLKKQFILLTMLLVGTILLVTFVALMIASTSRMQSESYKGLDMEYRRISEQNFAPDKTVPPNLANDRPPMPLDTPSPFITFYLELDEHGNLLELYDKTGQITEAFALNAYASVQDETQGSIASYNLRYKIYDANNKTFIGFIDNRFEKSYLNKQGVSYVIIFLISLVLVYGISLILANRAIDPISKAWKKQQQFVADASHELKTPLTIMLANTSILLSEDDIIHSKHKKWINHIDEEATHMQKLVHDLLFLARVDQRNNESMHIEFDLSDLVMQSVLPFEPLMFEQNRLLAVDIAPNLSLTGEKTQIKQLVSILLDNALKYSKENSTIKISLNKDNNEINLSVNNCGEIIEDDDIAFIFDRFYKIDESRTRNPNSYGLGLAIAKEIVDLHNGIITVSSNAESGTTFVVKFS